MAGSASERGDGDAPGCGWGSGAFWPPPAPAPAIDPLRRPVSWFFVGLVKCYQRTLSRLWPNVCKFHPSCSNYMLHAVAKRGLIAGGLLGAWRIARCNPFSRGGYDPPPGYEEILEKMSRDAGA